MSDFVHGLPGDNTGVSVLLQAYVEGVAGGDTILGSNAGESVYSRSDYTSSTAAASAEMVLAGFVARKTQPITQIRVCTSGTAAAATPTVIRMGVYSRNVAGDLTLLASHAHDATLFAATNTVYTKTLTSTFFKVAGVEYYVGICIVSGAAMPTFAAPASGWPAGFLASTFSLMRPATHAKVTALADLPSSVLNANVVAAAYTFHALLLP